MVGPPQLLKGGPLQLWNPTYGPAYDYEALSKDRSTLPIIFVFVTFVIRVKIFKVKLRRLLLFNEYFKLSSWRDLSEYWVDLAQILSLVRAAATK